ncbi:hypothetical protein PPE_05375 [Paenibacillus polymyxa E681]|nr:hypothetical protein PPE_05375 [Paenibacillus polymyxa E681]
MLFLTECIFGGSLFLLQSYLTQGATGYGLLKGKPAGGLSRATL